VIILALILTLNLNRIVAVLGTSFLGVSRSTLFYIAVALVPVISGTLMGAAIVIISKKEDQEYERIRGEGREGASSVYDELTGYFNSIDASIAQLRDVSEKIKHQAEAMEELERFITQYPGPAQVREKTPEIYSITAGDAKVTNLRVIHPVDGLIPQEPAPLPQSHQKIWFFPRK
jgi:ABC-type lipopolysaccharide export system ATPase subunit